jgi:protein TonB
VPRAEPTPPTPAPIAPAPPAPPAEASAPAPAAPAALPSRTASEPAAAARGEVASAPPTLSPPNYKAAYLSNPPPAYPRVSRRNGEEGTVVLRVRVSAAGAAIQVQVERTSGSERLDAAALEAVKAWRFVPARRGAEAIEASVLVPIVFSLSGTS